MTELAVEFTALRPYLMRVAYSHLGGVSEAEDVVQDAWLRLQGADAAGITDLRSWLTVTVSRLALDVIASARFRRESYVGTWLPEPVLGPSNNPVAERVTLDDSVSYALMVILESLSPAERCAFLLHDVFGYSFAAVADVVGRTPQSARQLAARARKHVEERRPRFPATAEDQRKTISAFLDAAGNGDIAALLTILDPDVEFRSDGGGLVTAVRVVLRGATRVADVVAALVNYFGGTYIPEMCDVNGEPGLVAHSPDGPTVVHFEISEGHIRALNVIRNPEKLRHVQ